MHIHILGICGTFMGGVAALAKAAGYQVSGSDAGVYPPMSDSLRELGVTLYEGYAADNLHPAPDCVVIGNALSRGNPEVEAVLEQGLAYISGPQWLAENLLRDRWVLAVAGTHGKTTTASMLAWILEHAGLRPGFLIGGLPANFGVSARAGKAPFFVVEADEYDTAFFDKRSKFLHYRPRTAILNNLEYDHADIFPDLAAIQRQFHHLVRTVPASGQLIYPVADAALVEVLAMGCWSEQLGFGEGGAWDVSALQPDWQHFAVLENGEKRGEVRWQQYGEYNAYNALAAILAARHAGVPVADACAALAEFTGVRRRLELIAEHDGVRFFDDFAHHPTAITATLKAVHESAPERRLVAVLEPCSNTMRQGIHQDRLAASLALADHVLVLAAPDLEWDVAAALNAHPAASVHADAADLHQALQQEVRDGDEVVLMSNGNLGGLRELIRAADN